MKTPVYRFPLNGTLIDAVENKQAVFEKGNPASAMSWIRRPNGKTGIRVIDYGIIVAHDCPNILRGGFTWTARVRFNDPPTGSSFAHWLFSAFDHGSVSAALRCQYSPDTKRIQVYGLGITLYFDIPTAEQWLNVAFVLDGGRAALIVGDQMVEQTGIQAFPDFELIDLRPAYVKAFGGWLECGDWKVWDEALSFDEVQADFAALPVKARPTRLCFPEMPLVKDCAGAWAFGGMSNPLRDASGKGNDAIEADATLGRGLIKFDGTQHVKVTDNPTDFIGLNEFTVGFWVKLESDGSDQFCCGVHEGGSSNWQITTSFFIVRTNENDYAYLSSADIYDHIGEYAFVVGVYTGSQMRFYINGTLVGSADQHGTVQSVVRPFSLGARYSSGVWASFLRGEERNIFFVPRALTNPEIQAVYRYTVPDPSVVLDCWGGVDISRFNRSMKMLGNIAPGTDLVGLGGVAYLDDEDFAPGVAFTVEAMMIPHGFGGYRYIASQQTTADINWAFTFNENVLKFFGGSTSKSISDPTPYDVNAPVHVIAVLDGDVARMYRNGEKVAEGEIAPTGTTKIRPIIGARWTTYPGYTYVMNGRFPFIRIMNEAKDDAFAQDRYKAVRLAY